MRTFLAGGVAVVMAAAFSTVARAAIQSVSGQMTIVSPPPSVEFDQLESNTTQFAFAERQCVTLGSPLPVNITVPGTYSTAASLTPGKIAAGTLVSSHFIHADQLEGGGQVVLQGTLTTDATILGVIIRTPGLDGSDFLGAIGTLYPTGFNGRGVEFGQGDTVTLDAGLQAVTLLSHNRDHVDQVRVLTECKLPPRSDQGCTPGYWKQDQHFDSWLVYSPTDSFNAVFGVTAPFADSLTLVDALGLTGGGANALARHAVAALLNSVDPAVNFGMTPGDVIAITRAALLSANPTLIEGTKNSLAVLNERTCPLN
jgi:hypothetical protein